MMAAARGLKHSGRRGSGEGSSKADERHFRNPFPELSGDEPYMLPADLTKELKVAVTANLGTLEARKRGNDQSVYTGEAGVALLHLHCASTIHVHSEGCVVKADLESALRTIKPFLVTLDNHRSTFLCGAAGPLAIMAILYHKLGMQSDCKDCVSALKCLQICVTSSVSHELLYGHTGYLYALLLVAHNVPDTRDGLDDLIEHHTDILLTAGEEQAKDQKVWSVGGAHNSTKTSTNPLPGLMYTWHDKHYLGAAHGLVGILMVLLQVKLDRIRPRILRLVKSTVDYLLTLCYKEGNLPSSLESIAYDRLVHWCHGCPGLVHLLALSYQEYDDDRYLKAALQCGDVVWRRGLLRKGYGLCHGVAGNAYTFLRLYKLTGSSAHLYRAAMFARWCLTSKERECRIPDRPLSLFEGLAGVTMFYCDLLCADSASFPGLDILDYSSLTISRHS